MRTYLLNRTSTVPSRIGDWIRFGVVLGFGCRYPNEKHLDVLSSKRCDWAYSPVLASRKTHKLYAVLLICESTFCVKCGVLNSGSQGSRRKPRRLFVN